MPLQTTKTSSKISQIKLRSSENLTMGIALLHLLLQNNNLNFREDYEITAKPNARNAAYVPRVLQLHTDLPYYDFVPGVCSSIKKRNVLLCLLLGRTSSLHRTNQIGRG